MQPPLFAEYDLVAGLEAERRRAREKIESLNADLVLSQPLEILVDELVQEFGDEELVFLFEEWSVTPPEDVRVDVSRDWAYGASTSVSGTRVQIRVPFRGNENLLRMKASTFSSVSPHGQILGGAMVGHNVEGPVLDAAHVEAAAERFRRDLTKHAEWINADIRRSNEVLRQQVTEALQRRREKLLNDRRLTASLSIPIRPRGTAATYPAPVKRSRPRLIDRVPSSPFSPEPAMEQAVYEDVLEIVSSATKAFERSPSTFASMGEEQLRDHVVVMLNGNYGGAATGETFNGSGKTDILLRVGDRNAFIGECKVWSGAGAFAEAIEQLRGYLVWRDTKAALVLFIRNRDVTAVIEKARRVLAEHEACVRVEPVKDQTMRSDFVLRSALDDERLIRMALLPVVMPQKPKPTSG